MENITNKPDLIAIKDYWRKQINITAGQGSYNIQSSFLDALANLLGHLDFKLSEERNSALINMFLTTATLEDAILLLAKNQYLTEPEPSTQSEGEILFNSDVLNVVISQDLIIIANDNQYKVTEAGITTEYNYLITSATRQDNIATLIFDKPILATKNNTINIKNLPITQFNVDDAIIIEAIGNSIKYQNTGPNITTNQTKTFAITNATILNNIATFTLAENFVFPIASLFFVTGLETEFNKTNLSVLSVTDNIITASIFENDITSVLNTGVLHMQNFHGTADNIIAVTKVKSVLTGLIQNTTEGELATLEIPIENIGDGYVGQGGLINGSDDEEILNMKSRILSTANLIVSPHNEGWFAKNILSIPNVTRYKLIKDFPAFGKVSVLFVYDNRPSILPTVSEINLMQEFLTTGDNDIITLDSDRILVSSPLLTYYDINVIGLTPNNSVSQEYVRSSIVSYFTSLDFTNGELPSENKCLGYIKSKPNINGEYVSLNINFTLVGQISELSLFLARNISFS